MQIEGRNGLWRARVRRSGAPDISRTFKCEQDAIAWAENAELAIERGALSEFQHRDTVLGSLLERYQMEVSVMKKGARQERSRIGRLLATPLAKLALANLTRGAIRSWRDTQKKGPGVNRSLALLGHALKWARAELDAPVDPSLVAGLKLKERGARTRRLLPGEEEKLMGAAPQWLKPFITILLETGLRRGELAGLTWRDVDLDRRVIVLADTKNNDKGVAVPLSTRAVAALRSMPRGIGAAPVLQLHADDLSHAFRETCSAAGVCGLRLRDLRAECVSRLFEKGLSLPEVWAISRHKSSALLTYIRPGDPSALLAKLG